MLTWRTFNNFSERTLGVAKCYAILRALRAGNGWFDRTKVQFEGVVESRGRCRVCAEKHLFFAIRFDERDLLGGTRCELQVCESFGIDREKSHRRTVFRRHVGDRCAIWNA